MPMKTAYKMCPHAVCVFLYEAARGMDESPLVTHWEPKSFSSETTFQEDVRDWQVIARTLAYNNEEKHENKVNACIIVVIMAI